MATRTHLAAAMDARCISVRGLSAMLGRSRTTVGRWRTGERVPPVRFQRLIARKFHVPLEELFIRTQAKAVNGR